jgi:hypothetical protein
MSSFPESIIKRGIRAVHNNAGVNYAAELRFTFGGDQLQGFWLTGNSVNHPLPLAPAYKGICTGSTLITIAQ